MNYIIENEYLQAEVSDLGATLVRLVSKKSNTDVVLGYEKEEDYLQNWSPFFGATVGRNANRIANARFVLNGKEYKLSVNDNTNQLHGGGINGFSFKRWKAEQYKGTEITFSYLSKNLEEGFPGELLTKVTYKLDKNKLLYVFTGICDQDTIFNLTNHSYFNLGDKDIRDHVLQIHTDKYSPTDQYALTLDEVRDCAGTAYDFIHPTRIGDNLDKLITGIDNNFVWETLDDKLMSTLSYRKMELKIYSDLPDMHVYTAHGLKTDTGKNGKAYGSCAGIAMECQYYPNGINYGDKYLLPILKKDTVMSHYIAYEINDKRENA